MKILALSDLHGSKKILHNLIDMEKNFDFLVIAGDFSKHGDSESGRHIIDYLNSLKHKIITVHGNWDNNNTQLYLKKNTEYIHGRGIIKNNTGFFGLGGSNKTPMKTPVEYSDEEINILLSQGFQDVSGAQIKILVSHTPPKGIKDRTFLGIKGGSQVIADFLKKNNIDLCICGHIHEATGFKKSSSLLVINAASVRKNTVFSIDLNNGPQVTRIKL